MKFKYGEELSLPENVEMGKKKGGVKNLRVVICTRPLTAKARVAEHYTNRGFSVSVSSAPEKVDGPLILLLSIE